MRARLLLALLLVLWAPLPCPASPDSVGRYAVPDDAPYTAEEVRIRCPEGHVLAGTLTRPRTPTIPVRRGRRTVRVPTRVPVVVLVSDAAAEDRDLSSSGESRPFRQIADTLSRRGIAVLRLDDRGVGASTGSLDSTDMLDRAADVRVAIEYLRNRRDIAEDRIGLAGYGEGALIATLIASTDPGIRGIVLMSPGWRSEDALPRLRLQADVDTSRTPSQRDSLYQESVIQWQRASSPDRWQRFFGAYDSREWVPWPRVPVSILASWAPGTRRSSLPIAPQLLASSFQEAGNRDVSVREFANGSFPQRDLLGALADWIVSRLGTR